jgi:hypothetical protein
MFADKGFDVLAVVILHRLDQSEIVGKARPGEQDSD